MGSSIGPFVTHKFETCPGWGAKLSLLFSTYPLQNTPVAVVCLDGGRNWELPILTRIYPSVDRRIPPVSPQCFAMGFVEKVGSRGADAAGWYDGQFLCPDATRAKCARRPASPPRNPNGLDLGSRRYPISLISTVEERVSYLRDKELFFQVPHGFIEVILQSVCASRSRALRRSVPVAMWTLPRVRMDMQAKSERFSACPIGE
jgi:hypothetical protein